MTYLLDTDVMIDFFKFQVSATGLLQGLSKRGRFAFSALLITELRSGWSQEQANRLLPQLYELGTIEPVNKDIAQQAGVWRHTYKAKGRQLATPDTVIAATAYLKNYVLVTNNTKDYPMPELRLYHAETM